MSQPAQLVRQFKADTLATGDRNYQVGSHRLYVPRLVPALIQLPSGTTQLLTGLASFSF
jgi:hypothetical protein